ncbi:IclR family transcriptional regulator C-terminal domain-containing protein [Mesorhizobium sp.]|uniref:IclR family transcriptional regulator domain-containing protein n=1 Tax=Mesorhizobium sp. TaxID=1871066 RepID=UPI0025F79DA6|nr:IclR family transcriptional regulator C-terminal domain-containing protein [Mesorhizobium sp.]
MPEAERRAIFTRCAIASPTGRAETDENVLARAAAAALEQGLSIQAGESDFSVACIAAPIRGSQGACRATISIVVPDVKLKQKNPDLITMVKTSARRIESRLGWRTVRPQLSGLPLVLPVPICTSFPPATTRGRARIAGQAIHCVGLPACRPATRSKESC